MRKLESVFLDIDFCDASYSGCEMTNNDLTVYLCAWDEKAIRIVFSSVVQFSYRLGDVVAGVYMEKGKSPFLDEALSLQYEEIPLTHPCKLYSIVDIYDFPFFRVVAEDVNIQVLPLDQHAQQ